MKAFKCDYCSKIYEHENTHTIVTAFPKPGNTRTVQIKFHHLFGEQADLCKDCYEKMIRAWEDDFLAKAVKAEPIKTVKDILEREA